MKRPAVRTARLPAPALNRRLLAVLAVLAFFLQSLAVQTHIHAASPNPTHQVVAAAGTPLPGPLSSPDLDQGSCRLCQEMAHSGAYITPAVSLLPAVLIYAAEIYRPERAARPRPAPAFGWQSRGPPVR